MDKSLDIDQLRVFNFAKMIGAVDFGSAGDQTGIANFFNSSSQLATAFQAGNATAALTYTFPTAGPVASNYLLASSTVGVLSWLNAAGTYAPIGSNFVTIGADATLTNERALTGTSNQVVVTDNGAGSTVVLSTPQNIHTGASPTFVGMTLSAALAMGTAKITGLGNGTAATDAAAFGQVKVIQILTTTTTTTTTTTSSTYQTTSLAGTITPTSASNRIFLMASGTINSGAIQTAASIGTLFRGTTELGAGATQYGFGFINSGTATGVMNVPWSAVFIDSPATTSATTYSVKLRNDDNVTTVKFGNTGVTQSIVLAEIV